MASAVDRLAGRIESLAEQIKQLQRQGVGLGQSSFDDGQINQYTDGTLGSSFGTQFDGTNGVVPLTSPPPPTPAWTDVEQSVTGIIGGIRVRWGGEFVGGAIAPMGFSSIEVHVSDSPDLSALLFETLKTNITSPRGGEVLIPLAPGTYYVRLVCRSTAGRAGTPSAVVGPVTARAVVREDLGFDLSEIAGNTVFRGSTQPTQHDDGAPLLYGDLWLQTPDNVAHRYEPPGTWNSVQDQNIVQAINDAADAAGLASAAGISASQARSLADAANTAASNAVNTANQASEAAQAAMDAAQLAQQSGGTGINVYRQATPPTNGTYHINDLWLDTADSNMLFVWSGSAWLASDDQRIALALTNASTAQTVAGAKTTLYAQVSPPATTGRVIGDTWIDTDDSNRVYVWTGSAWSATLFGAAALNATARQLGAVTTYRQASTPTGTLIAGDLWIDSATNKLWSYSGAAWVASQDTGIQTALTNAGTAQTTANGKTTTFYQTSAPTTTGRVTGDLWIDTDDGNKIYTWSSAAWAATTLSSQALNVTARQLGAITIYRQTSAPTTGVVDGDYWIDSSAGNKAYLRVSGVWTAVQDAAVQSALTNAATAQATADGKAVIYYQTSQPTGQSAVDIGDQWVDTDDAYVTYTWSGAAWVKNAISTSSFQPNSLIASTVVATGSVTAALLEATLVLATTIIAGNINGTHAKMMPDGFHVFRSDPSGGRPVEVIRLGVAATNDFFAIVNSSGMLAASIDDSGRANLAGLNVTGDPTFQGRSLSRILADYLGSSPGRFAGFPPANNTGNPQTSGAYGPIQSRVGIAEVNGLLTAGRDYEISWIATGMCDTEDGVEGRVYLQVEGPTSSGSNSANAPTVNSPEVDHWLKTFHWVGRWETVNAQGRFSCTTTGRHRFLLTSERGGLGRSGNVNSSIYWRPEHKVSLLIRDIGPTAMATGQFTQAGAAFAGGAAPAPAPVPPVQSYTDIGYTTHFTYRGDGSLRSDTTDVVQGYDPSGNNGDGYGYFGFNNIPSITGSVDRVDLYLYFYQWYFNSGGSPVINLLRAGDTSTAANFNALKLQNGFIGTGWPKPGGLWFTVPTAWFSSFSNAAGASKAVAVALGSGGGTNGIYYGRASDCRLRIWYTQ